VRVAVAVDGDAKAAHVRQPPERLLAMVGEREGLEHRVPHEDVLQGRLVEHLARGRQRVERGVGVDEAERGRSGTPGPPRAAGARRQRARRPRTVRRPGEMTRRCAASARGGPGAARRPALRARWRRESL
jgi:hypothetical protein